MRTSALGQVNIDLETAAFIAIINSRLMPNGVQFWLRYTRHSLQSLNEPMQCATQDLIPELPNVLLAYISYKHSSQSRSHQLFLCTHCLTMLCTYCPVYVQRRLLKWMTSYLSWIQDSNN
jgi:hypothetical protein